MVCPRQALLSIPNSIRLQTDGQETAIPLRNSLGSVVPAFDRAALLASFGLGDDAHVLVLSEHAEQQGDAVIRPNALQAMSFRDVEFDLALWTDGLTRHSDPAGALTEVQRVARAGLIEAPSWIAEVMAPEPENRWIASEEAGALALRQVPFIRAPFRHVGRRFLSDPEFARRWDFDYRNVSRLQFAWRGSFQFRVEKSDWAAGDLSVRLLDRAINALRYGAGAMQDALRDATAAAERDPRSALAWNTTGVCLWASNHGGEALECFRRAAALQPGNAVFQANSRLQPGQQASLTLLDSEACDTVDIAANWAGKVYYAFVGYDDRLAQDIGIRPEDLVLDVGGGQRPLARADVSVDFDVFEGVHRQGQTISRSKPLVCGDVQRLPFSDGAFDVVCCRMVLEHVNDPAAALCELQRVGKKVFIEVPNALWECFYGHPCHRWFISLEQGALKFRRKREAAIPFRSAIVPLLYTEPDIQRRFEVTLRNLSTIQIVASGDLRVEVEDDPANSYDYNRPEDAYAASMLYAEDLLRMGLPGVAIPEIEDALRWRPGDERATALRKQVANLVGGTATEAPISATLGRAEGARPQASWSAPLFDPSGYAEEARHFLLSLERAGVSVAARSIRWSDRVATLPEDVERSLSRATERPLPSGCAHVSHILAPHFEWRDGARLNIGRTMFETDRLPDAWVAACNRMDRVWVPSEFNRETFAFAGVLPEKLRVVPGTIDLAAYHLEAPLLQIEGARGFNFLSVFDWSIRKGWDALIRAFVEEFSEDEDVSLTIKTHSSLGYTLERIVGMVSAYVRGPLGRDPERIAEIIFQDGNVPAARMPSLYAACDCVVLPTRGEGWGRPFMEAMAMARPVIGTNWSGNTAFMTRENSYLLDYTLAPVSEEAVREASTFQGHRWAEPNVEHLRSLMREVFANQDRARQVGRAARADLAKRFGYETVAQRLCEELEIEPLAVAA